MACPFSCLSSTAPKLPSSPRPRLSQAVKRELPRPVLYLLFYFKFNHSCSAIPQLSYNHIDIRGAVTMIKFDIPLLWGVCYLGTAQQLCRARSARVYGNELSQSIHERDY